MNMWGRYNRFARGRSFRLEQIGQHALSLIGNLGFSLFVIGVLIFTIIAATYEPEDPLFHPSTKMTTFLTSTSNATFASDVTVAKTGEDFMAPSQMTFVNFVNLTDIEAIKSNATLGESDVGIGAITDADATDAAVSAGADADATDAAVNAGADADSADAAVGANFEEASEGCEGPINCRDPELFYLMMKTTIEKFPDMHFYKFGKPVRGSNDGSCDMAWRFRPKEGKTATFYKDYRRFDVSRTENCTYLVGDMGEYHSGVNARKKKGRRGRGRSQKQGKGAQLVPVVGEAVNDSLPVVESENSFVQGKYLLYNGRGDRCKSMNHYLWSFLCSLGEAQYLNRTLVMDLTICLNSMYSSANQDEEGKDFRFYFDFEHLNDEANVLDQTQFWDDWNKWNRKHKLKTHLVEDFRVTPMKLAEVEDTLIMRKFGSVEPDNYWYRVCEGETESVVQRPWHLVWKSKRLMDIVSAIASKLEWNYDAVHIERGDKAKNKELWPNLDADTSPSALLSTLGTKIEDGRNLYIATNEPDASFFDPLKDKYATHFLSDYKDLWDENSDWYIDTMKLNKGVPVEFDGYMKISVDTEVFLRGKKQIETFRDLTNDCKDGVNTCVMR